MEDILDITYMILCTGNGWGKQKKICIFYKFVRKLRVKGNIFYYSISFVYPRLNTQLVYRVIFVYVIILPVKKRKKTRMN